METLARHYPDYKNHQLGHDLLNICMSYLSHTQYFIQYGSILEIVKKVNDIDNGPAVSFHDNKGIKAIYDFVDGKIHGEYRERSSDGHLTLATIYNHGSICVSMRELHPDGRIRREIKLDDYPTVCSWYLNGNPEVIYESNGEYGQCEVYHNNGALSFRYKFKIATKYNNKPLLIELPDGISFEPDTDVLQHIDTSKFHEQRYGLCEAFGRSGTQLLWCVYSEGKLEGKCIYFNGDIRNDYNFLHGELHGECTEFDIYNGQMVLTSNYRFGKRHGPTIYHLEAMRTDHYKNGELNGYIESFGHLGLRHAGNYRNGKKEDIITEYSCYGNIEAIAEYKNDLPHGKRIICSDGTIEQYYEGVMIAPTTEIKNGEYHQTFEDGQKMCKGNFVNGLAHGVFEEYYQIAGSPLKKSYTYCNGVLHGPCKLFRGNSFVEIVYKNGIIDGPCTMQYGGIRTTGIVHDHFFIGPWKQTRISDGKLIAEYDGETVMGLSVNKPAKFYLMEYFVFANDWPVKIEI